MQLYRHHLFPAAYDLLMGMARMEDRRRPALVAVRGEVLEIGIGTGLNLDYYPPEVRRITGLDPNPGMLRHLESRRRKSRVDVTAHCAGAERMPFADQSFDTVVSTHTLPASWMFLSRTRSRPPACASPGSTKATTAPMRGLTVTFTKESPSASPISRRVTVPEVVPRVASVPRAVICPKAHPEGKQGVWTCGQHECRRHVDTPDRSVAP